MLWVCGCHMGRGGVTDLAMALSLNLCIMQRLPGDSWHLWLPQWTRQQVLLQAPSWLCWERLVRFMPSSLLGVLAGNTQQVGGGSSMTLGLKMIIFCTWKLGVGMKARQSSGFLTSPSEVFCCPVPSGSPINVQLQVLVPSCAAWGKVSDFSEPWLPHRKKWRGRGERNKNRHLARLL